ncbi:MAG: hypothetical protein CVU42_13795 [Chloroflexi bacterium HGW-Chloroflexi-4]|jgi:hypothetical protein|nr:MAG: hypothetical protein CVU42_13795 [Chloroflexi bacterium HGW-Chloroflexi-4]
MSAKKKAFVRLLCGLLIFGLFLSSALLIKSEILQKESFDRTAMENDPLWVNGNEHLISQMQYSVEHLNAQLSSMYLWLEMEKNNHSLIIYATWKNQLEDEFFRSSQDLKDIKKMIDPEDLERLKVIEKVEVKFAKARGYIRYGVANDKQKLIDLGAVMIKDLIKIMNEEMNWK